MDYLRYGVYENEDFFLEDLCDVREVPYVAETEDRIDDFRLFEEVEVHGVRLEDFGEDLVSRLAEPED